MSRLAAFAPLVLAILVDLGLNILADFKDTAIMLKDAHWNADEQAEWAAKRVERRRALLRRVPFLRVS